MTTDFDPISAEAARQAINLGVYGTREHARIEARLRGEPEYPTAEDRDAVRQWARQINNRSYR